MAQNARTAYPCRAPLPATSRALRPHCKCSIINSITQEYTNYVDGPRHALLWLSQQQKAQAYLTGQVPAQLLKNAQQKWLDAQREDGALPTRLS